MLLLAHGTAKSGKGEAAASCTHVPYRVMHFKMAHEMVRQPDYTVGS